jgi:hypothetical protein
MAIQYTNLLTTKFAQIGIFGFERMPSGNPGSHRLCMIFVPNDEK